MCRIGSECSDDFPGIESVVAEQLQNGLFRGFRLRRSEKLLKISKVSYAWKTYRKHFSRSLDFVEIIPRPRLVPL